MIERIQTVFLFLVGLCLSLILFFPIWQKENLETKDKIVLNALSMTYTQNATVKQNSQTFYIAILALVAAGIAIYTIFQYKNRLLQIKFCLLNTLLISVTLGAMVLANSQGTAWFEPKNYGSFGIGFYLPAIALVFNMLARRFIKQDEDLVRSSDRLR